MGALGRLLPAGPALLSSRPVLWGSVATVLIALGSYGDGAVQYRGGIPELLKVPFIQFGHGSGVMMAFFWAGMFLLVHSWASLGYQVLQGAKLSLVNRALVWWSALFMLAGPILSRDVYSYLMQGAMLRDGFDPYSQGASVNPGPLMLEVSHDWRNTTTPYGPLHLWLGKLITSVTGDGVVAGVMAYKVVSLLGFVAICWAVPKIAVKLGSNPALAAWLGVANPVMMLHLLGGIHNEAMMVGMCVVGVYWALEAHFFRAIVIVALAVSLKATGIFILPFIVWLMVQYAASHPTASHPTESGTTATLSGRVIAWVCRGSALVGFLVAAVANAVGLLGVLAVVSTISGAGWGWVTQLTGNSKVINPLALPTLLTQLGRMPFDALDIDYPYNAVLGVMRSVCQVIMLVGLVAAWWYFRKTALAAVRGMTAAYGVAVVFNSVTLPWYYASVISLVGAIRPPWRLLQFIAWASMVISLSFSGGGNHRLYWPVWMLGIAIFSWLMCQAMGIGTLKPQKNYRRLISTTS